MNNQFNSQINWQPFNNQPIVIQTENNASSSGSSIPGPSAFSRVGRIEKENFPVQANAQMPYVNLSGRLSPVQTTTKIQKQIKTRASAQKTQQVSSQSPLPKGKRKYNRAIPSQSEIEALYHLPLKKAAKTLDICESKLQNLCRNYGLKKWPYKPQPAIKLKLINHYANSLVSPAIAQPSSIVSTEDTQDYRVNSLFRMADFEGASTGYFNSHVEEPSHSFRPIERDNTHGLEHLHSVPDFPIPPPRLPSISQLNLSPLRPSNDKPLTGDAILRKARQALNHSNSSLNG